MELSDSEQDSPLWQKLLAHLSGLIAKKHMALEKSLDADQTANIRGQIKAIRAIAKIGQSNQDNDN